VDFVDGFPIEIFIKRRRKYFKITFYILSIVSTKSMKLPYPGWMEG
jgi:hypothetical protein